MATSAAPKSRSTRATTKFRYQSAREPVGSPKSLITARLEDVIVDDLAKIGNTEHLSLSATLRLVLGLGIVAYKSDPLRGKPAAAKRKPPVETAPVKAKGSTTKAAARK